jgi:hypothetical protein
MSAYNKKRDDAAAMGIMGTIGNEMVENLKDTHIENYVTGEFANIKEEHGAQVAAREAYVKPFLLGAVVFLVVLALINTHTGTKTFEGTYTVVGLLTSLYLFFTFPHFMRGVLIGYPGLITKIIKKALLYVAITLPVGVLTVGLLDSARIYNPNIMVPIIVLWLPVYWMLRSLKRRYTARVASNNEN